MDIDKLKKQLEIDEGVKYEVYFDSLGFPTFGIGHLITKNDVEDFIVRKTYPFAYNPKLSAQEKLLLFKQSPRRIKISESTVKKAFEKDIKNVLEDCRKLFDNFDEMFEELKQIIANMMFNLGLAKLSQFVNLIKAIKRGDYEAAAQSMENSLWYKQVGKRAERLVSRMRTLKQIKKL